MALEAGPSGEAIVIAASPCSSSLHEVALPWLPLEAGARLEVGDWMTAAWRMGKLTYEMAAAPLGSTRVALLAARRHGPRFRSSEIANLALLARIASAASYSRAP